VLNRRLHDGGRAVRWRQPIRSIYVAEPPQEIERYACSPGQACSYMTGKVTILRLRDKAKKALGAKFNIGQFHDAVLLSGALPLAVLEARVDGYIAAAGRS
jgi:uncharacterized protein (DUF885 family)